MTNNEILQANYLDILFEHRNKDYGAYALRNEYNQRLWLGLGTALSVILFFVLMDALGGTTARPALYKKGEKEGYILRSYNFKKQPEQPFVPKLVRPASGALLHSSSQFRVVADNQLKMEMPASVDGGGNEFPTQSTGVVDDGSSVGTIAPAEKEAAKTSQVDFLPVERAAEFPGGVGALTRFFYRYLKTPDDLGAGERRRVLVRFDVDSSGLISAIEVLNSGGAECDSEVIRVCKKMPRWRAAIQNGIKVAVRYIQPVTFVGGEQ